MQEYSNKVLELYEGIDIKFKDFKQKTYDVMKQHRSPLNWMKMKPPVVKTAHAFRWNYKGKTWRVSPYPNDAVLFG